MTRADRIRCGLVAVVIACAATAWTATGAQPPAETAFTNARLITGAGARGFEPQPNATIIVRDGKIVSAGPGVKPPAGARVVDLAGGFVVPGFISAHAHVSDVNGLSPRAYTDENTRRQLGVYARYGVTSVFSLGGEQAPAFALRDAQSASTLDRARLFVSGDVVVGKTPEDARAAVARGATLKPDFIKIRVDDNLGSTAKMAPEVYRAIIDEAHKRGLRVAAHIFYLADVKGLLDAGVDIIAHSVRDAEFDADTLARMKARNVPYIPTLTRETSAFAYETSPAFLSDPFLLKEADAAVVAQLKEPARQQAMAKSTSAQRYKAALGVAMKNLKRAADAGVLVAMGTDSGAFPERFQGYFEHLEMQMMVEAGLTPAQVLRMSTADAARAMGRTDIGTLEPGRWADFVVLEKNPLQDISGTKTIKSVWVAGNAVR
jgi:imidazolonepropionase-like amidohydrolase